jgi:hypothetical protein
VEGIGDFAEGHGATIKGNAGGLRAGSTCAASGWRCKPIKLEVRIQT